MNLTIYGDDSKGLIRLDPRTKLLIFLSSSFLSLQSYNLAVLFLFGTILCAILALCGKGWLALKAYVAFSIACYIRYVFLKQASGVTLPMVLISGLVTIFLFAFPVVLSFLLLSQTTRIAHFLTAFQAMRLPSAIIIPIAVLFRFLPAIQEEWGGIRKAMAFRGIDLSPISILRAPTKAIEHALIPLLFSSISVMDELAAAAMARGMDAGHKRTSYETVKLGAADYVVMAIFVLFAGLVIVYGKWGTLR